MKYGTHIFIVLILLLAAAPASARSNRVGQLPNGGQFGCDVCHTAANGLNDFGFDSFDYTANGNVQWGPELAALDSDRDGYTNGMELGDPNGTWRPGQNNPGGPTTDPGDPMDNFCGNGSLQGAEECEGNNLQGESCNSLGLGNGTLRCGSTCSYDTSGCGTCGDGIGQPAEECDQNDLQGASCEMLGFTGGLLTCNSQCAFDTTSCDGSDGSQGFSLCGDGLATGAEDCDTFDLRAQSCSSLGFQSGTLDCNGSCEYNTSRCEGPPPDDISPGPADAGISAPVETPVPQADNSEHIKMNGYVCASTRQATPTSGGLILLALVCLGIGRRRKG